MTLQIRIMLVDDHQLVRASLAMFLDSQEEFILVGEASDGMEAVSLYAQVQPDVVLMDLMMPEMDGIEATRHILQQNPKARVVVLTSSKEDTMVRHALEAGAMSYVLKNASLTELTQAIFDAWQGKAFLAPEAAQALIYAVRHPAPHADVLTPREKEVLALMVEGMTNVQMSQKLVVGMSTIKFHVSSILAKLNASSRTEAVSIALQNNLLAPMT